VGFVGQLAMAIFLTNHNAIQRYFPRASRTATDCVSTITIPLYGTCGDEDETMYCVILSKLFASYTLFTVTKVSNDSATNLVLTAMGNNTITIDAKTDIPKQIVRLDDTAEYGVVFNNDGAYTITSLSNESASPSDRKFINNSRSLLVCILWWLATGLVTWLLLWLVL
jgi:hypothetical protein